MGQVVSKPDMGFSSPLSRVGGNCCAGGAAALADEFQPASEFANFIAADPTAFVSQDEGGHAILHLLVEGMHCANCIQAIEKTLKSQPAVLQARVNFSTRRLLIRWDNDLADASDLVKPVIQLGYGLTPYDPALIKSASEEEDKRLLKAMGVAGFAAANVMLLSVSVWAGMFSTDMGPAMRDFMHWVSALIAMPAVAYSGQVFFKSAVSALRAGRLNMDVPISLAVILAVGMSLSETIQSGEYAYFDAAVTLLFFLLIGRYLDNRARSRARSAAERLLMLKAVAATVVEVNGDHRSVPVDQVVAGTVVFVAAGDRFPVDGVILDGQTSVDNSLVTGESLPINASAGTQVFAGTLNLGAPVKLQASKTGEDTLLGDIVRLMENAEQGRANYVRIADRIAEYYAPAVHILAALTFAGWWLAGNDWQISLIQAVAVLIVTCPCALGLAVPVVQVVASGRLLQGGVLVKSADGLERLAQVQKVIFDKTGTLTEGRLDLVNGDTIKAADLKLAASLAVNSRHPLAQALCRYASGYTALEKVSEHPGAGLSAMIDGQEIRLGSRQWCFEDQSQLNPDGPALPEMWLCREGMTPVQFLFQDCMRSDVKEVIDGLKGIGISVELLSGDREDVVADVARFAGIEHWSSQMQPGGKVARLQELQEQGHKILMVGDGLNDAPALTAAHVSMSPANAADVSQTAADFIFQGKKLIAVLETIKVARKSQSLVTQNFGLAFAYNAIAVPLAIFGFVTPLFAAIAMSASSLIVCANSMRLSKGRKEPL